jgi:hypothetical protein
MFSLTGYRQCTFPRGPISCRLQLANLTSLNLSRQTGKDPSLVGLLRVFKDYYPEIIVREAIRGKASAFKVGQRTSCSLCATSSDKVISIPTFSGG